MECPSCKTKLAEGATWCISCGAAIQQRSESAQEVDERDISLSEAKRLREAGLYADAIQLYTRLLNDEPQNPANAQIYELLGDCCCEDGNIQTAAKVYQQAIQLQPTDNLREKYDHILDQLRVAPSMTTAVSSQPVETVARKADVSSHAVKRTDIHQPGNKVHFKVEDDSITSEYEEEHTPLLARLRSRLTPRMSRYIIGAAAVLLLCSILITFKPWVHAPVMPTKTAPIIPGTTDTSPSGTPGLQLNIPVALPTSITHGKTQHYVKPKGELTVPSTQTGTAVESGATGVLPTNN